ncbi:MAG: hypothetical protein QW551_06945 [Desulfurococcaceae archaeon]
MDIENNRKLFLSSGKIIKDYGLLIKYLEICKQRGHNCEEVIPDSNLLTMLKNLIEETGSLRMDYAIQYIKEKIGNKLNCDLAIQAFRELYGLNTECEEILRMLLSQLTGWYIEILDTLGYIRIKYSWRPE